jgi:hypothetical protein
VQHFYGKITNGKHELVFLMTCSAACLALGGLGKNKSRLGYLVSKAD